MLRNYFISALRNIIRNKIQSIIQVLSLTIGIIAVILIGLYAKHELGYDRFNEKFDRIYRLEYGDQVGLPSAPGHQIKQNIPEVENVVRLINWMGKDGYKLWTYYPDNDSSGSKEIFKVEDWFNCDSTIFDVFSFNFIQGDPETALRDPNSIVFTESTAKKLFAGRDPVGDFWGRLKVTGIIEDVKNSHIEVNMLTSIAMSDSLEGHGRGDPEYLNAYGLLTHFMTYIVLPENNDPGYVEKRINDYFSENMPVSGYRVSETTKFKLRPLKDIYFTTNQKGEKDYCRHGNLNQLRILITVAVFILLLAIINYSNLATARASLRAKEVSIRKVAGSSKGRLFIQFLVEASVVSLISFLFALTLVQVLLPEFNQLAGTVLSLEFLRLPDTWILFLISVIIIGMISGAYPAVYMTNFQPVTSLSGKQMPGSGSAIFRRALLTFQFAISIVLIMWVFVVFRQLHFMKSADLGFNKDFMINVDYGNTLGNDHSKRQVCKQQLLNNPNIKGVSFSGTLMGGTQDFFVQPIKIKGMEKKCVSMHFDSDFLDVMEINLLEGRTVSWDRPWI
jgi:putative ABC transport system permease protein